jgi:hypothetical protein
MMCLKVSFSEFSICPTFSIGDVYLGKSLTADDAVAVVRSLVPNDIGLIIVWPRSRYQGLIAKLRTPALIGPTSHVN